MVAKMKHNRFFSTLMMLAISTSPLLQAQTTANKAGTPVSQSFDSLTVQAIKAAPNKATLYEIAFSTRDTLASDAEILLTFPPECDLSALEIAGSSTINGGWTLAKNRQQVTLRRTGLGDAIAPAKRVSLKLGLIKNPADFNAAHRVEVEIRPSAKKQASAKRQVEIGFK